MDGGGSGKKIFMDMDVPPSTSMGEGSTGGPAPNQGAAFTPEDDETCQQDICDVMDAMAKAVALELDAIENERKAVISQAIAGIRHDMMSSGSEDVTDSMPHVCQNMPAAEVPEEAVAETEPLSGQDKHLKKSKCYSSRKKFNCLQCPRKFTNAKIFRDHARVHSRILEIPHVCNFCRKKFREVRSIVSHVTARHKTYSCSICHDTFKYQHCLINHTKYHTFNYSTFTPNVSDIEQKEADKDVDIPDNGYGNIRHERRTSSSVIDSSDSDANIQTIVLGNSPYLDQEPVPKLRKRNAIE